LQIDTVKQTEKERIRSQMRHQWPWPTCKQNYNRPTVYIRLLNVFARVFSVASRLSIVCLSVLNMSQKVWNGFWRNFQRRSAIIKYMQLYSYTMHFANRLPFSQQFQDTASPQPSPQISQFGGRQKCFFVPRNSAWSFRHWVMGQ